MSNPLCGTECLSFRGSGRLLRRSGVAAFRLYDLRHTWATRAVMSGIDLVTLAAMLGHSRIQMVLRYAHPTSEHQAQAVRKLEEFNAARQVAEFEEKEHHPLTVMPPAQTKPLRKTLKRLEARVGIEPTHKGFADLSLTTWVPRPDA